MSNRNESKHTNIHELSQIGSISSNLIADFKNNEGYLAVSSDEKDFIQLSIKELVSEIFTKSSSIDERDNRINILRTALQKFEYFPLQRYSELFEKALENFLRDLPSNITKVYIMPGADIGENSVKSFQVVMYMFRGNSLPTVLKKVNRKIKLTFLKQNHTPKLEVNNTQLLFVDDFIGSGESLTSQINIVQKNIYTTLNSKNLAVLCLVIEKKTQIKLKKSFKIYAGFEIDSEEKISSQLIKKFPVSAGFHVKNIDLRNFGDSILLSMIRTPNNTVPFFYRNEPFSRMRVSDE